MSLPLILSNTFFVPFLFLDDIAFVCLKCIIKIQCKLTLLKKCCVCVTFLLPHSKRDLSRCAAINQSTNQSINQSINQSYNHTINQSENILQRQNRQKLFKGAKDKLHEINYNILVEKTTFEQLVGVSVIWKSVPFFWSVYEMNETRTDV